jgi:hypothetical protein
VPHAHKTAPRCFLACVPPPPCPAPPVGAPPPPSSICRREARPEEAAATSISATPSRSSAAIHWPRSSTGASPPSKTRAGRPSSTVGRPFFKSGRFHLSPPRWAPLQSSSRPPLSIRRLGRAGDRPGRRRPQQPEPPCPPLVRAQRKGMSWTFCG